MKISRHEKGPRMSQIVIHGDMIYLAGQVGRGPDMTSQTKDMLASVDRHLATAGSSKSRILQAQIWVADMALFGEMNAVWDAWVDPENTPARACVESKLATPDFLVEVMITAVKG